LLTEVLQIGPISKDCPQRMIADSLDLHDLIGTEPCFPVPIATGYLLTGLFSKLYRPRCQWKGGWFRQFTRIPLNRCPHHQLVALFRCAPFPGFCLAFTSHSKVGTCEE